MDKLPHPKSSRFVASLREAEGRQQRLDRQARLDQYALEALPHFLATAMSLDAAAKAAWGFAYTMEAAREALVADNAD